MVETPRDLATRLAIRVEAVCRHYLSNGHRQGRYWLVGDVRNTPGRSMFVRLKGPGSGKGAAGKWTDAATGEHGDLLDVIRESLHLVDFRDVAEEARSFLSIPSPDPGNWIGGHVPAPRGSTESARRLLAMTQPVERTLVEEYLRNRGITALSETCVIRYHPRCYYRADDYAPTETWPAMIAAVTDLFGKLTGAHRTWLDPGGFSDANLGRAPLSTPRRAMGNLLGHAVRFGTGCDVMLAGEGIETTLSVKSALPHLASMAALSAGHLAAIAFPHTLRRLYVARDNDPAGDAAMATLFERTRAVGIEAITLSPRLIDFNEDLRLLGLDALTARLKLQVAPQDVARFMCSTG
ncbi:MULTISPECIES: toprim domain-containing protein [Aminobacter]|uniref:DUF7146 domain-containing protein n=2 Tax=Phyllobacteriaceae TaxID=69277 RepID=UPI00163C6ACD|nr:MULTISPECIES: toprim domain-containing protein [Aminobacter]MDR7225299.1 hypothetical protein [Aminobacter aminovorans]QNH33963.1 toprim domain-containing protein [Aminobacter sp. MDW-2]